MIQGSDLERSESKAGIKRKVKLKGNSHERNQTQHPQWIVVFHNVIPHRARRWPFLWFCFGKSFSLALPVEPLLHLLHMTPVLEMDLKVLDAAHLAGRIELAGTVLAADAREIGPGDIGRERVGRARRRE
jgi:hypothetical protein